MWCESIGLGNVFFRWYYALSCGGIKKSWGESGSRIEIIEVFSRSHKIKWHEAHKYHIESIWHG